MLGVIISVMVIGAIAAIATGLSAVAGILFVSVLVLNWADERSAKP
jgi:hypothetical protein